MHSIPPKRTLHFLLAALLCSLAACAQTFDLSSSREPIASLDGLWRFHTGDSPTWADPAFDDSQWPLLRSSQPWNGQGYSKYGGFAWYRFSVSVPAGVTHYSLYLGPMETAYQLFVDGKPLGGFGHIRNWRALTATARVYELPAVAGPHTFRIAIRAWHAPVWSDYAYGGFYNSSYIGTPELISQRQDLDKAEFWNTLVNSYVYAVLSALVGLVVLLLFFIRRDDVEYLWFALVLLGNAADITLNIFRQQALLSLPVYDFLDGATQCGILLAALAFFSVVLRIPRSRSRRIVALLLLLPALTVPLYAGGLTSVGVAGLLSTLALLPASIWILVTLFRGALRRNRDALILLVPTLLWQFFPLLDNLLLITWQFGWQRKAAFWSVPLFTHPFPLMPGTAAGIIFIFALLLFLIRRFSRARQEETRLSGELESARTIQSLLIPEQPPATPGFAIESAYIPASEVGGDFFQLLPAADGSLLVIVGDVSGKGLQAAMTVASIIGALRGCPHRTPAEILAYLNRVLHGQVNGFVICTAALIQPSGRATLANAGNLSPYRNGQELDLESGLPLGITSDATYAETALLLHPNDRLTFVSDGVVEATNDRNELFGFHRTQAISTQPATSIAEAARQFGQSDDITVLALTFTPSSQ